MAPVYLAQKSSNPNGGPNILKAKGVSGYVPSTLSSLATVGIPHVRELAFDGYYRNLDAFIAATVNKKRTFCDAPGYFSSFQSARPINLPTPAIAYVPKVPIAPSQEDVFKNRIGASSSERTGKTMVYNITKPSERTLENLIKSCSDSFASGPDLVTPIGYKAYLFIRDVITEFLAVHSYSAFSDKDLKKDGTSTILALQDKRKGESLPSCVYTTTKKTRWEYVGDSEDAGLIIAETDDVPEDEEEKEKWQRAADKIHNGIMIENAKVAVLKAKPSPHSPEINFGPATQIPTMPGLAFPYIPGMNTPDSLLFKTMTATFFIRLLGMKTDEIQRQFISLRRGFNSLATTTEGKLLAHILAGIKLAMESQARLFVIFDSEYRGFCLLGTGFTIVDGAQAMSPLDASSFAKDLSAFNPHLMGLEEVVRGLNELKEKGCLEGQEDVYMLNDIGSEDQLITALAKIHIPESVDASEITSMINKHLKFIDFAPGATYRRIDPTSINDLIDRITTYLSGKPLMRLIPCKFTTYDAPYGDRLYRILAEFGIEAPSPWNGMGAEVVLAAGSKIGVQDDAEGSARKKQRQEGEDEFANMPSTLIFAPKLIYLAFNDWKRCIEKGAVKMDLKERARAYRCCEVKSEKIVESIWKSLLRLAAVPKKDNGSKKVDKGKKKQTVVDLATSDDILSLFA